jgi:very-short-patch-repair endonuclease
LQIIYIKPKYYKQRKKKHQIQEYKPVIHKEQIQLAKKYRQNRLNNKTNAEIEFRRLLHKHKIKFTAERIFHVKSGIFYIVDFYIQTTTKKGINGIAIEINGSSHIGKGIKDNYKDDFLRNKIKAKVIRYTNKDIFKRPNVIIKQIKYIIGKTNNYREDNPYLRHGKHNKLKAMRYMLEHNNPSLNKSGNRR